MTVALLLYHPLPSFLVLAARLLGESRFLALGHWLRQIWSRPSHTDQHEHSSINISRSRKMGEGWTTGKASARNQEKRIRLRKPRHHPQFGNFDLFQRRTSFLEKAGNNGSAGNDHKLMAGQECRLILKQNEQSSTTLIIPKFDSLAHFQGKQEGREVLEGHMSRMLKIKEEVLGRDHPLILDMLMNLAFTSK